MLIDILPIWLLFLITVAIVALSVEVGFRIGQSVSRKTQDEMESVASSITGVILGLQAFMLAFTFSLVSERYDQKKHLVRKEAHAIRTMWRRADFLQDADQAKTNALLKEYLERRIAVAQFSDIAEVRQSLPEFRAIQKQFWDMAITNGRLDMNSDIGALYIEAVNEVTNLHAERALVGMDLRIPTSIWIALHSLLILGMIALGFQCAIAHSRRSRVMPFLAIAFSLVISLIAALDYPGNDLVPIPQQPLRNVLAEISEQTPPN